MKEERKKETSCLSTVLKYYLQEEKSIWTKEIMNKERSIFKKETELEKGIKEQKKDERTLQRRWWKQKKKKKEREKDWLWAVKILEHWKVGKKNFEKQKNRK